jgi:hypothetical protein
MKNNLFVYLFLVASIAACITYECSQLLSSDPSVTEYKRKDNFGDIVMSIPGNIYFINSADSMITIEGPESVVENLSLSIANNTLHLDAEDYFTTQNWKRLLFNKAYELSIYIPVNSIEDYKVSGLGTFLGDVERLDDKLCIHSLGLVEIHIYQQPSLTNDEFPAMPALLSVIW